MNIAFLLSEQKSRGGKDLGIGFPEGSGSHLTEDTTLIVPGDRSCGVHKVSSREARRCTASSNWPWTSASHYPPKGRDRLQRTKPMIDGQAGVFGRFTQPPRSGLGPKKVFFCLSLATRFPLTNRVALASVWHVAGSCPASVWVPL